MGDAYWAVCGRSGNCKEQERSDVPEELHEVRCCSDSFLPGFVKKENCSVWGQSLLDYTCYLDESHDSAQSLCAESGARLCKKEELEENCTAETECGPANKLVWSSTISTTTTPSMISSASPSVTLSAHPSMLSSASQSVTSSPSSSVTSSA